MYLYTIMMITVTVAVKTGVLHTLIMFKVELHKKDKQIYRKYIILIRSL